MFASRRSMSLRFLIGAAVLCPFVLAAGCGSSDGPDLVTVEGTVTMDGKPLPDATVIFQPKEGGRPSFATTNEEGEYELQYSPDSGGVMLGEHVVSISTYREGYNDGNDEYHPPVAEMVPAEYNVNAADNPKMNVEITGSETLDFHLKSGGRILSPAADDESQQRFECRRSPEGRPRLVVSGLRSAG